MKNNEFIKELNKENNFDIVVNTALKIIENVINEKGNTYFTSEEMVNKYLILNFKNYENEVFSCLFLDNKHRLIAFEEVFKGTINQSQVYPRVIVQKALKHNAAAVIFAHNHPSGDLTPSESDKLITRKLIEILNVIDVRVLDHFIVCPQDTYSMAQHGEM